MKQMNRAALPLLLLVFFALPLGACKDEAQTRQSETVAAAGAMMAEGEGADKEASLALLEMSGRLQRAASTLRTRWLCLDEEISFDSMHDEAQTAYNNQYAPDDYRCHVFHDLSGLRGWTQPNLMWLVESPAEAPYYGAWYFNGSHLVLGAGTDDQSTHDRDLIAFLPYVRDDICTGINNIIGIAGPDGGIPVLDNFIWDQPFKGRYGGPGRIIPFPYRLAGCFNDGGKNVFFQVLLVR